MIGETVDILTPSTVTDPYSAASVADWSSWTETAVPGCVVWPRDSTEPTEVGRTAVITGLTVSFPAGTSVTSSSRVRVRGTVWDVEGKPFAWRNPFSGHEPGVVANLTQVEG